MENSFLAAPGKNPMHKLITTGTVLEHELSELRSLIERQTGIVLDCPNSAIAAHVARHIGEWAMKIALFCLEASRDDYGCLRIRFVLCVLIRTTGV